MKGHKLKSYCLYWVIFLISGIFWFVLPLWASQIQGQRTSITVVVDDNYPPYVFRDEQGKLVGKLVDEWRLWQEKTGIRVILTGMDWADCLHAMASGKADVIDTAFRTAAREEVMDFLPPHSTIPVAIYTHKDITGIADLNSLRGFVVGVKAGDACVDWLNDHGIRDLRPYSSYQAILNEAVRKNIQVFCMDEPPANFLIHRQKAENDLRYAFHLYNGEFHRAVKKGDKELLELVQKGFSSITSQEYERIHNKWMGKPLTRPLDTRLILLMWLGAGLVVILTLTVVILRYLVIRRTQQLTAVKNHLEATLNAIPDLLFEVDISGRFYDFHSSNPQLLFLPKEAFLGKTLVDCLPPELAEAGMKGLQQALREGKATGEYALSINGELKWFEFTVVPKQMPFKEQQHFIFLSRDVTAQKEAALKALEAQRQLLQSQKLEALGRLAGGIAHDLNNFLMPVLGYAEMGMHALNPSDKLYGYFQETKRAAERAALVVKQVLTFSKKAEAVSERVQLNSVIEELKNGLFQLLGEDIQLQLNLAPDLFSVFVNKNQMEQVLMNLVLNARDAMPQGGVITIETSNQETHTPDGVVKQVVLRVKDTGCGMSKAVQERIFDPFFTTKGPEHGTGLGLSNVYGIVKQYGGEIAVESEVGKGTTFTITLPAMVEEENALKTAEALQQASEPLTAQGLEVVVVDDDEHIVSLVSMVLQADGHRVRGFSDPAECLRLIEDERPSIDILITDVAMPGISGPELRERLKSIYSGLKTLFISGYGLPEEEMTVLQGQDAAMLQKPFGILQLTHAIAELQKKSQQAMTM